MKTSILISAISALYLLVTFAEAPRRHGEEKINFSAADPTSIATVKMATLLPGVVITADRKKGTGISVPSLADEDLSYLKFDASMFADAGPVNPDETGILPEAAENEYSYLKFNVNDYTDKPGWSSDYRSDLPLIETPAAGISASGNFVNEFEYLRFNVGYYINLSMPEPECIIELPLKEAQTGLPAEISVPAEPSNEFINLKFDVSKYYLPDPSEPFELPVE